MGGGLAGWSDVSAGHSLSNVQARRLSLTHFKARLIEVHLPYWPPRAPSSASDTATGRRAKQADRGRTCLTVTQRQTLRQTRGRMPASNRNKA